MVDIIEKNRQKVDNILKKLDSSDYDFDKEEIFLILKERSLQEKVFSSMKNDDSIWNYPIVDEFRYYVKNDIDYAYNYAVKDINNGIISLVNNDVDKEEWNEKVYELKDVIISKLKDENYELKQIKVPNYILSDILDAMLESKRYDDLEKLRLSGNTIDNKIFDKFMLPFEKGNVYKMPIFNKNNLNIDEIIQKYGISKLPLEFLDECNYDFDYNFFLEKLENSPKEFYYFEDDNESLFNVLKSVSDDEKRNLISLFIENDYFEPFFKYDLNYLLSDDDIDNISKSIIKRKDSIDSDIYREKNNLFNNEKIILSFIKTGNFSLAFYSVDSIDDYEKVIRRYEKEIIDAINNSDKKIDEIDIDIYELYKFPEIIKALIKNDPSLEILSFIFPNELYDYR